MKQIYGLEPQVQFLALSSYPPPVFWESSRLIDRSNHPFIIGSSTGNKAIHQGDGSKHGSSLFNHRCSWTVLDHAKFLFCSKTSTPKSSNATTTAGLAVIWRPQRLFLFNERDERQSFCVTTHRPSKKSSFREESQQGAIMVEVALHCAMVYWGSQLVTDEIGTRNFLIWTETYF